MFKNLTITNFENDNYRIESVFYLFILQANAFNLSDSIKQSFSNELNTTIISCTYNLFKCNLSNFDWYYDSVLGNCFRFNSLLKNNNKNIETSNIAGSYYGLQMEIYLGNQNYTNSFVYKNGLRVMIHNNSIIPSIHEGIDVSPGLETSIQVRRTFDYKKPYPYNKCIQLNQGYDSELYRVVTMKNATYRQTYMIFYYSRIQIYSIILSFQGLLHFMLSKGSYQDLQLLYALLL